MSEAADSGAERVMARLNAPPGGRDGACSASDVGRPGGAGVAKRIRGQSPLKRKAPLAEAPFGVAEMADQVGHDRRIIQQA